jgi:hypothetical protein
MRRPIILIILIILFIQLPCFISAQILKGTITSQSGEPIQYATVYIQELKQGTTANTKGDYELKLPAGKYMVTYQSLGFSPVFFNITIYDQTITRNVTLPLQYYEIPEVRITATGEDPAYGIMRKAIGMAPYYLNNISYYKADVYLKGNLVINKIPKLMQKALKIEASNESGTSVSTTTIKEGDVFMMESYNEIEFTAPDKYVQKVISINSTFPDEGDDISPMDIINASFYQPIIDDLAISPLSPQAFSHYNFKYLGATPQGNIIVNKIKVTPKRKSQQLFEGIIYIIEDLWCLYSVDLTNENIAGTIGVQQLYIPVQDDIWMPVSHNFNVNFKIIGIRADASYGSSVKYNEVIPNNSLRKPESVDVNYFGKPVTAQPQKDMPVTKNQEKIEEILEKDELSNRDMVRLARLMEKESEEALPDSTKNTLEIKNKIITTVEEGANQKDSTYWTEIRPIPLSDIEMKSIRIRDSIKMESSVREMKQDTIPGARPKKKNKFIRTLNDISFGHTWSDTTGFSFRFGGLLDLNNFSFNTVDGFVHGIDFSISKRWKNNTSLSFYPDIRYAFSREQLLWRLNGNFSYDRVRQKQFFFRAGMTSRDIGTGGSINSFLNSVTSLFFEKNYLKLFENRYFALGHRSRISIGTYLELTAEYDDRRVLKNNTSFAFVNSTAEYSDNTPDNFYLSADADSMYALGDQKHFEFVTSVSYTPRQKYRIINGAKIPWGSDWPTFNLMWKHGINEFTELTDRYKHFDMIRFEVSKEHDMGAFSEFRWRVRTGGFINKKHLTWYDFFHFDAQPLPVLINDYQDAFRLSDYYSLSAPEFYGEVHIKYTTPYFLLKYLPGFSKTLMRENLSLSWLGSEFHKSYTEIGYSITELFLVGELGVYTGFKNLTYESIGVRLVLRLD